MDQEKQLPSHPEEGEPESKTQPVRLPGHGSENTSPPEPADKDEGPQPPASETPTSDSTRSPAPQGGEEDLPAVQSTDVGATTIPLNIQDSQVTSSQADQTPAETPAQPGVSDPAQTQEVPAGTLRLRRLPPGSRRGQDVENGASQPPAGSVPPSPPPQQDSLPRRVEEVDPNATQVTPAAYQSTSGRSQRVRTQGGQQPGQSPGQQSPGHSGQVPVGGTTRITPSAGGQPTRQVPAQYPPTYRRSVGVAVPGSTPIPTGRRASSWKRGLGCVLRLVIAVLFIFVFIVVAAGSWLVFQYFAIASDLPPVEDLRTNAATFETTRIYDRNGGILYEIIDPNAGRRTMVPLSRISPNLVAATIATEDREFYNHPGFDPFAIARAFWYNYTSGGVVSGASTITQQLARMLLLSPEERNERTYERKAREIVLAAEITRKYSKDEILELYLNESNYGNLAYGIEAAAETYFGTSAQNLTLGQAAFLAGLPQSPAVHDVYTNREETLARQKQVVLLMLEDSQLKNCIVVSNSDQPVCVDEAAAIQAVQEMDVYQFNMDQNNYRFPHWVTYIRSLLEEQYDLQDIYRMGLSVYTTLDPVLQEQAQAMVTQQVASLAEHNAHNGALVAIRPSTGEILAMVGSPDFNDEDHAGQVNMAISPRQPGSSIKPLTYAAAFEKGWTPSTLIWDVPSGFPPSGDPNDTRPPYQPQNYDGRFHGPVTVRTALANSYNIPAVKALQHIGIYNEGGLVNFARRLGINTLTRPDYGLSLTLGGGEVTLLDMTSAFGTFANGGKRVPPVAITKITDFQGNTVFEYKPVAGEQVVRPDHAFLISSILSDNNARTPMFGPNSVLNLPFQVAAKTGTTNDFRDNWTLGYTPDLAVGVWIGNADYTDMQDVTGLTGAAPAWANFMQYAVPLLTGGNPTPFQRPDSVEERVICDASGTEPSESCPQQHTELFARGQPPLSKDNDLWKKVRVDTWTGLSASAECSDYTEEKQTLNVQDPWAITWIKDTDDGRAWAAANGFGVPIAFVPQRECKNSDPRPEILFAGIADGQTIQTSPLDVYIVARASQNFESFRLEWGRGDNPSEWTPLVENITNQYANPERIYTWDLREIPAGMITLRVYMESTDSDRHAEKRIRLNLNVPTPTPTPTPTITITPSPTNTLVPSHTPTPTLTPVPTETPTPTEPIVT